MYSGVGVALTAAKTLERNRHRERERGASRENNRRERERCVQAGGVTRSCFDPTKHSPPLETKEGVTAVTRSLRGVIVV